MKIPESNSGSLSAHSADTPGLELMWPTQSGFAFPGPLSLGVAASSLALDLVPGGWEKRSALSRPCPFHHSPVFLRLPLPSLLASLSACSSVRSCRGLMPWPGHRFSP